MLERDERRQLLVTSPFADHSSPVSSSDGHVALTLAFASSDHHPLRSRSVSPARRGDIPSVTVVGSEGETRPRLTRLLSLDGSCAEEDRTDEASRGGSDVVTHPVGPNDTFAGLALRYDVSIAALRRANHLWPSDPIHIRTELVIPRGDTFRVRHKPTGHGASSNAALRSTVEPTPNPDLIASSLATARNMFISVLPARISLESLSSKTSASEDHELDEFQNARATDTLSAERGCQLPVLAAAHAQYGRSGVSLSSQVPLSTASKRRGGDHIPPVGDLRSRSFPLSPAVSLEQLPPFSVFPVRTAQLEPEPALELPVRRPRI